MLPTGFQDVAAVMEVSPATWRRIFNAAGERGRLKHGELTHPRIWESITTEAVGAELVDALQVLAELGTNAGRDLLQQAADDQQVNLKVGADEPVRELVARIWIESRTSTPFAEVLVRARLHAQDATSHRVHREYVGKEPGRQRPIDRDRLRHEVATWCEKNLGSGAVEVYSYKRDNESRFEVLRGDVMKRVVEIKDGRPAILNFRPAFSDHIRYDAETGRLGIATRSPRLLRMYRSVIGKLLTADEEFFFGENICTLKPLQEQGAELFKHHWVSDVLRVDIIELRWRRADRDKFWVRSPDCFRMLADLGARLHEGDLFEAKLAVQFAGGGRHGRVSIKVPNRIDINAGTHERTVEKLLDEVGIRGAFGEDDERPKNLWELYPWRLIESEWRRHVGPDFDRLVRGNFFKRTLLATATHPDHPTAVSGLEVQVLNDGTHVGASEDPAIPLRTLTTSDVGGYELNIDRVANELRSCLELGGPFGETDTEVLDLGRRDLTPTISIAVFLAARKPSPGFDVHARELASSTRPVLIVPDGLSSGTRIPEVACHLPAGPFDAVLGHIVDVLGVRNEVPPTVWLGGRVDLIVDIPRGRAWFKGVELTRLVPDTHPFTFSVALAKASGRIVSKADLHQLLSRTFDEGVVRTAKSDALKAIRESFAAAGRDAKEVGDLFPAKSPGYALAVTAHVIE